METKPNRPYESPEVEEQNVSEPAVAYEVKSSFYGNPAPKTEEEMSRFISKSQAAYVAGQYTPAKEAHQELLQYIDHLPCDLDFFDETKPINLADYPADYPWAPRTKEEVERWKARQDEQEAAGVYYTNEEVFQSLDQQLGLRLCE